MKGFKEIYCQTCGNLIKRFRRSAYPRGHVPKELILRAIRRHYKEKHPRKFKEFAKKAVRTKIERGILDPYASESVPTIKARRKLINKPRVRSYHDIKASGLIRILERSRDLFPEFALYPPRGGSFLAESLKDAGFKEEERGKWVLRTNRFSIFVYL